MNNTIEINAIKFKYYLENELKKVCDDATIMRIMRFTVMALEKAEVKADIPLLTVDEFIDAACLAMDTSFSFIARKDRNKKVIYKRYAIIWFLRNKYHLGFANIGDIFKLDHSTIMNANIKASEAIETSNNDFLYYFKQVEGIYL